MRACVIILIGPIGSGKGTQADILAKKFGFFHLETSRFLEEQFKNAGPQDRKILEQKEIWERGELNDPAWVTEIVNQEIRKRAAIGEKIIFSASPRTLPEAEKILPLVEEVFDSERIVVFNLKLSEAESIKRNSGRRICQKNRHPIPNFPAYQNLVRCPEDNSPLVTRSLDKPEIIKTRFREYETRTKPILDFLRRRGYEVAEINGEQSIKKVAQDILTYLHDHY